MECDISLGTDPGSVPPIFVIPPLKVSCFRKKMKERWCWWCFLLALLRL